MLEREVKLEELVGKPIKIQGIQGRVTTVINSGKLECPWDYEIISSISIEVIQSFPLGIKESDSRLLRGLFGKYKLNKYPLPPPHIYYSGYPAHKEEEFELRREILRKLYLENLEDKPDD